MVTSYLPHLRVWAFSLFIFPSMIFCATAQADSAVSKSTTYSASTNSDTLPGISASASFTLFSNQTYTAKASTLSTQQAHSLWKVRGGKGGTWDKWTVLLCALLVSYIPLSYLTYVFFRHKVRCYSINLTLRNLELVKAVEKKSDTDEPAEDVCDNASAGDARLPVLQRVYAHDTTRSIKKRLLIPVTLTTAIAFAGTYFLFTAQNSQFVQQPNLFFGGIEFLEYKKATHSSSPEVGEDNPGAARPDDARLMVHQYGAALMLGYAVLGAVLWGLQHIVRRYERYDINSTVYYSLGVRILLSASVAVVFFHSMESISGGILVLLLDDPAKASNTGGQPSALLISMGFLIGMFPQRGLWWLRDKVRIFSDVNPDMPKLPLDIIPGITHHHVVRFREISIDNCYILANHRLVPLLLQTPYDPEELIDWILRAKLYVHLPEAVNALRNIGVRDVLDLDKANDTDLRELAAKTELTEARLLNVRDSVKSDCQLHELKLLRERLADFGLLESAREFDSHVENET